MRAGWGTGKARTGGGQALRGQGCTAEAASCGAEVRGRGAESLEEQSQEEPPERAPGRAICSSDQCLLGAYCGSGPAWCWDTAGEAKAQDPVLTGPALLLSPQDDLGPPAQEEPFTRGPECPGQGLPHASLLFCLFPKHLLSACCVPDCAHASDYHGSSGL